MKETPLSIRENCPFCQKKGRRVSQQTIKSLLKPELADDLDVKEQPTCCSTSEPSGCNTNSSSDTGWRFCDSTNCDVVYFSTSENSVFLKPQIRVEVGVKETSGNRPLCYCFGHSVETIKQELRSKGESESLATIRKMMNDPGCSCSTKNPSGNCCLGSVAKGIKIAEKELQYEPIDQD